MIKIQQPAAAAERRVWTTCSECGDPYDKTDTGNSGLCDNCRPEQRRHSNRDRLDRDGKSTAQLGYGNRWRKLSERARAEQPFCSDCGTSNDLTADHTTAAWHRYEQGLPIRLEDIDVVCRACNTERGPARGEGATDAWRGDRGARLERERAELEQLESDPLA